jgi:hypothetical protein
VFLSLKWILTATLLRWGFSTKFSIMSGVMVLFFGLLSGLWRSVRAGSGHPVDLGFKG